MAHTLRVLPRWRCILVKWAGRFDADELRRVVASFDGMALFHQGAAVLHDAREWDLNVPTADLLDVARSAITRPRSFEGTRKAAFVVADSLAYGMLQVIATLRERPDLSLRVFRDLEDAKAWLGLEGLAGDPFEGMDPAAGPEGAPG